MAVSCPLDGCVHYDAAAVGVGPGRCAREDVGRKFIGKAHGSGAVGGLLTETVLRQGDVELGLCWAWVEFRKAGRRLNAERLERFGAVLKVREGGNGS